MFAGGGVLKFREWCVACVQCAVAAWAVAGCTSLHPKLPANTVESKIAAIPEGAAPVLSWRRERKGFKTYWGDQDLLIEVSAYLPEGWRHGGDGFWRVKAVNAEGTPIPFLGVIRRYVDEKGTELAVIVPKVDLKRLSDGLYLAVIPGVEKEGEKIKAIRPKAMLYQIRRHAFTPFRVKIPLIPRKGSALTPRPEIKEAPEGTPAPL